MKRKLRKDDLIGDGIVINGVEYSFETYVGGRIINIMGLNVVVSARSMGNGKRMVLSNMQRIDGSVDHAICSLSDFPLLITTIYNGNPTMNVHGEDVSTEDFVSSILEIADENIFVFSRSRDDVGVEPLAKVVDYIQHITPQNEREFLIVRDMIGFITGIMPAISGMFNHYNYLKNNSVTLSAIPTIINEMVSKAFTERKKESTYTLFNGQREMSSGDPLEVRSSTPRVPRPLDNSVHRNPYNYEESYLSDNRFGVQGNDMTLTTNSLVNDSDGVGQVIYNDTTGNTVTYDRHTIFNDDQPLAQNNQSSDNLLF